jgi:hypothetical protein
MIQEPSFNSIRSMHGMKMARRILAGIFAGYLQILCLAATDFARDVQPILHAKCGNCHGSESPQAKLTVLTRDGLLTGGQSGPAIVPGSGDKSMLILRVKGTAKGPRMPLTGEPLTEHEVQTLAAWIDEGAKWDSSSANPARMAPLALSRQEPPPGSFDNPIDAFVDRYLQSRNIRMAGPVADEVFVRRAYLDIHGLLPTPEQLARFLDEKSSGKRSRLMDTLLADRSTYAEHWISYWNDLLHNDEGVRYGSSRESIGVWLLNALTTNLPYDVMVRSLLSPTGEKAPKGYLVGVSWGGDASASQSPPMQAAQNSAQVFLGVNLKCASCHDSFVSRWKLAQSFGMASFFSDKPLEIVRCDVKTGKFATPQFLFDELAADAAPAASLEQRREQVAKMFTARENGRFALTIVNRVWRQLFGRGLIEPIDDMDAPAWDPQLLEWLASDFVEHGYDLQHLLRRIMSSRAYQLPATNQAEKTKSYIFRGPVHRRLTAEQFADGVSAVTGEWKILDDGKGNPGVYARNWKLKADPLARALGRPDRRQVVTERSTDATTLQALELVNGETLTGTLHRGARRLLAQLSPPAANLFDSGVLTSGTASVDIDITGASELRLVHVDAVSWGPALVVSGWIDAELTGPDGVVKLTDLPLPPGAKKRPVQFKGKEPKEAVAGTGPGELVYPIAGRQFTRFRATVGLDESSLHYDIGGKARLFIFKEQPDLQQMISVTGPTPVPPPESGLRGDALVARIYKYAVSRDPTALEREAGLKLINEFGADGLEDLLWIVFQSPEFQFIR